MNSGVQLSLWVVYLLLFPVVLLFNCLCPRSKFCSSIKISYGYNGVLRALVEGFLDLTVSVCLNLAVMPLHSFWQVVSALLSVFIFVCLITFPLTILRLLAVPTR